MVYNMKIPNRRVVMFAATIVLIVIITAGGYLLALIHVCPSPDMDFLTNNRLYTYIFEKKKGDSNEITVVTLYVDIGDFKKGTGGLRYTTDDYKNWMKTWSWLTNRVISFFDSDETLAFFRQVRSSQPEDMTVAIKINRTDMSAFKHLETIRKIFARPGYPQHQPNTVIGEYSCAMHAKHDALLMAIERGLVNTNYLAWMDIGLFRTLLNPSFHPNAAPFTLEVPDNFNSSCVSMSEVAPRDAMSKYSPWEYISSNIVWVSGGFVLGTKEIVQTFSKSYKLMVTKLLAQNMISTDQQVIGAMYSPADINNQQVCVRSYKCSNGQYGLYNSDAQYFCLPYICKETAEKRLAKTATIGPPQGTS